MLSYTATASRTTTMTEARVRTVMQKVAANFSAFAVAGLVSRERAHKWAEDITYLLLKEALDFFEVQISGRTYGLRYLVRADGSVQQDSASGAIDVYGIPPGTPVNLFASLRDSAPSGTREELKRRGWGFNGQRIDAPETEHRGFSNGGYGVVRTKLGTWP